MGVDPTNVIVDYITKISNLDESSPPPINLLKNNEATEFENGQVWILQNGSPKRLK